MLDDQPVVFVVDDEVSVRDSVKLLVDSMNLSVKCYDSALGFIDDYALSQPGCLVLDIKMPEMDGLALLDHLQEKGIEIPVIMVSGHGDIPQAVKALKTGAVDFLVKPYSSEKLRNSIADAIERDKKLRAERAERFELQEKFSTLTDQEQQVLKALVSGDVTKKIAKDLDVSLRTVQFRRESIMRKLDVSNRAELVRIASSVKEG